MNSGESIDKGDEVISRYYQKQYERFMKVQEKGDIEGAFFESTPDPTCQGDTLYTRLKQNPRIPGKSSHNK